MQQQGPIEGPPVSAAAKLRLQSRRPVLARGGGGCVRGGGHSCAWAAGAGARAAAAGAAGAWRKRGFGAAAGVDRARSALAGKDFTRRRASEQSVRGESGGNQ